MVSVISLLSEAKKSVIVFMSRKIKELHNFFLTFKHLFRILEKGYHVFSIIFMGGQLFLRKWFLTLVFSLIICSNILSATVNDSLKSVAYDLVSEGKESEYKNAFPEAEKKYNESIGIWDKVTEYDEYRAYPYYSLALLYRKIGNYQKSLEFYDKAEQILLNAKEEYLFLLSAIYSSMGNYYNDIGDYSNSLRYFKKATDIIKNSKAPNESVFSEIQLNTGYAYYYQRKFQLAINVCKNYFKSKNSINQDRFERLIGSCLIAQGKFEEAKKILESSLKEFKEQNERYTETFLITTKAYIRAGDLEKAEDYLRRAIPLLASTKSKNDTWQIFYYELKGEFLSKKAEHEVQFNIRQKLLSESILNIDKALLMNSTVPESNKIPYIDVKGEFINSTQVKDLLIKRAKILNLIADNYQLSGDKIATRQFQLLSLKTWESTTHFLHDIRISFLDEESKIMLSELQADVYLKGYELAAKLFRETGKEEFFQKMLFFTESGKSSTFLASMNAAQAKNFGGIPDSLLTKEKDLNGQLLAINQLIYNGRNSEHPDTTLLEEWGKNQFKIQKQHDELLLRFEHEFPNYYQFKYSDKLISIDKIISKLSDTQALIEYFVDEPVDEKDSGSVSILYFTKSGYKLYTKGINYNYVTNLSTVLDQLSNFNVGETNLDDFKNFIQSSKYLHSVLIEPIEFTSSITDLIVIPDGKLAYLSFDALIDKVPDTTHISFSTLDYLVRHFNFVYSYSATLHFEYFRNKTNSNSKILAFAPEYSGGEIDLNKAAYRARQVSRTALRPLPGAREEVIGLSEHFKCKAFIGNSATEQAFKKEAGNFGILHLAMHTMINDSIPMFSKLVFTTPTDSLNDGFLNTQEIYNMKLNAELAVLSACNTGSGQMRTGEGVMSMARAFLYAGCPSIMMTLWEVEDKSSAEIVLNFYQYLFKGYSKPESLRLSKLDYLEKADPLKSHPYFWMGYIVVGDPSPIKYHNVVIISILFFVVIVMIVFMFRNKLLNMLGITRKKETGSSKSSQKY